MKKACGFGFFEGVEGGEDYFVAHGFGLIGGSVGRDDVEENYGQAGVGEMRGDAGAHGSCAENCCFANLSG